MSSPRPRTLGRSPSNSTVHPDSRSARGQKTGLYLDQWANYRKVAALGAGRRVLDCFTNQGGFALACKAAGAAEVTGVDSQRARFDRPRQCRRLAARDHLAGRQCLRLPQRSRCGLRAATT